MEIINTLVRVSVGGAVVILPYTNSGSVAKRLKESDLVVTQPDNILDGDFDFVKSSNGLSDLFKVRSNKIRTFWVGSKSFVKIWAPKTLPESSLIPNAS
ncbi:hypothetical protein MTR_6g015915 [Medicago truncatula]|uniref:Uncharacterized protein n=1 Tax=Medicago truncatula TaxID=3880 RepID=A0A072U7N3_MEDTR|nr:hypothetical protein MTR_6g015915 [Medicago truncatula]